MNKPKHEKEKIVDQDFEGFDDEIVKDMGAKAVESKQKGQLDYPAHEELIAQINTLEDKLVRSQAELENIRRRGELEVAKTHKYAIERFARELLAVVDNLERALEQKAEAADALRTGVELTLKLLQSTLEKFGIKPVNPMGEAFDPSQQEAMSMQISAAHAPNTVINVLQKGYVLNDRLLRPALVVVAKAPESNN